MENRQIREGYYFPEFVCFLPKSIESFHILCYTDSKITRWIGDIFMRELTVKELLMTLLSIPSDSGSSREAKLGEWIYEQISGHRYFREHPHDCGREYGDDRLRRPVVWAYKKGKSSRTVLIGGHYDTADLDSYGRLMGCACDPERLREELKKSDIGDKSVREDLENENWLFGRGTADMKSGLAVALYTLFHEEEPECGILFLAVCDKEKLSSGMRRAVLLLDRLKERYGLNIRLCLMGEAQVETSYRDQSFAICAGGIGKILPLIVTKGIPAYVASPMEGLNANLMMAKLVSNIEWNTQLITADRGMVSQPPSIQMMKDYKSGYDATMPEYAACCVNLLFYGAGREHDLIKKLKESCRESMKELRSCYLAAYRHCLELGAIKEDRQDFTVSVMDLKELEVYTRSRRPDYEERRRELNERMKARIIRNQDSLQKAGAFYIWELIRLSEIQGPLVVIGIMPPYYPCVTAYDQDTNVFAVESIIADELSGHGLSTVSYPYCHGITDISYLSCMYPEEAEKTLQNITVPRDFYDIPFSVITGLNIPTYLVGPRARGLHKISERVYLPDVEGVLPGIYHRLVNF